MRRDDLRLLVGSLLVLAAYRLEPAVIAADAPRDDRMAAIVAAVRAEEAKFADIEYVARIMVRDTRRQDSVNLAEMTSMVTRRVVLQGDRFYLGSQAHERRKLQKFRVDEISAYDGERTRSVIAGNCASVYLGRFQHPDILPIHSLPLAHHGINFPLSVYLEGTDAIHAYLKYPADRVESGVANVFRKIVVRYEGEELQDGLRCAKLRVDRWYQSDTPPVAQHIWLAKDRSYHCVKAQFPGHEMRVDELRQTPAGTWVPMKVTSLEFDQNPANHEKKTVVIRTNTIVDEFNLAPRREAAFFRDVAIPSGLPVFTLDARKLVGSILPEPKDDDRARAKLAELAARVAAQEKRYDDIEVTASVTIKYFHPNNVRNAWNDMAWRDRSLLRGDHAYFASFCTMAGPGGWQDRGGLVHAFDGQWTRVVMGENLQRPGTVSTQLRNGPARKQDGVREGIFVYRPHTLMLRKWQFHWPLADLLVAPRFQGDEWDCYRFHYCGDASVDGHSCNVIRGDYTAAGGLSARIDSFVMYLATDRNDIPIKMDHFQNYFSTRIMPRAIARCGDLREIAPGLWYPFRLTELDLSGGLEIAPEWIQLNWQREMKIESVTLAPKVSDDLFHEVIVPEGASVQVIDEDGHFIGHHVQPKAGLVSLTTPEYLKLRAAAVVNPHEAKARQQALDALIGNSAPEFPRGATWTNGRPLTWQALGGRVVVLVFWAEWSDACRDDLERLGQLHRDRAKSGLTIVGVHPPGSEPAAIKRVTEELHLDFPTCVDVMPREKTHAWGDLFGRFAVRTIPLAMAIDGEGKVVACGRLEDVLTRSTALVERPR